MEKAIKNQQLCFHCGDIVRNEFLMDEKVFCCEGCCTVHKILSDNGMNIYYQMVQMPGNKISQEDHDEFAYLDAPEIAKLLIDFENDKLVKLSLSIPSIHCSSCIWLLEHIHLLNEGIIHSRVDFLRKEFSANIDPHKITVRELAELLNGIGYKPQITLENQEKKKAKSYDKILLLKLAVAGFCFGNIMLLSFPEYFGLNVNNEMLFSRFFSYLNLALGIPVLFYSASDYFISAFKSLSKKVLHINVPLALGMIALFSRSFYEIVWSVGPGYMDSFSGLLFFLLAGKWFQNYTYDHLNFERDYKSYFPLAITVYNHGKWESKLLSDIQKGDRLRIKNGELIPADAIILSGDAYIDYSFVTGESLPVQKVLGEMVYGGGKQCGGIIEVEITKEVSQSQLTKIWNSQPGSDVPTRLTSFSEKVSRYFTIVLLAIAFVTLGVWSFIDISTGFFAFTSVLIVACPCALALSSPLALGNTLRLLGKKGLYLKNAGVVEHMAEVNHIVFDKTGTLTEAKEFDVTFEGDSLSPAINAAIKGLVSFSNHPYSKAVYLFLNKYDAFEPKEYSEYTGKGIEGYFSNIGTVRIGNAEFCEAIQDKRGASVFVSINNLFVGSFSVSSHYRSFIKNLMEKLSNRYKISVLSGDSKHEREALQKLFPGFNEVYFEQTPEDKKNYIESLNKSGEIVMMVGDGLNDAGALLNSDVGIVVAENSSQFTPAAKGIIMAEKLSKLDKMMKLSKKTLQIIRTSFGISVIYNIVGIYFAVQGLLSPVFAAILMPLSSITVVLFNTIATNWWAFKLKLK